MDRRPRLIPVSPDIWRQRTSASARRSSALDVDTQKHKNTRVALEEVMRGRVNFKVNNDEDKDA